MKNDRLILIQEFESAPENTFFSQITVAAIRQCSTYTLERERWAGKGIPFRKFGRLVRYSKSDIRQWLEQHQRFQSTTQAQALKE